MGYPNLSRRVRLVGAAAAVASSVLGTLTPAEASVSTTTDDTAPVTGIVRDIALVGDRTILVGRFTAIDGRRRWGVGAILADGQVDPTFHPRLSKKARVFAVAVSQDGQRVYIGGRFTSVNGVRRHNLAALDAETGAVIRRWRADANHEVRTLEVQGRRLYVGGRFDAIDGRARKRLVALNLGGSVIRAFNPRPTWWVYDVEVAPGGKTVWVAGGFQQIGGRNRNQLAEVRAADGSVTSFKRRAGGGTAITVALSPDGSRVLVAMTKNKVYAYEPDQSNAPLWFLRGDGDAQGVAVSSTGEVYIGGHFTKLTTPDDVVHTGVIKLASLDVDNGLLTDWRPDVVANLGPWAIELTDTQVLVGGDIASLGGRDVGGFGRFSGTP